MADKELPLAIVTGSAQRLGRTFALALARQGFAIQLHYHASAKEALATTAEVRALGVPAYPIRADLTEPEQIQSIFTALDSLPHRLQVLINSAGMDAGGLIVNVTDVGAGKAWSAFPAYTVSKAALESLTRVLAKSFAPDIRVNAIAPGLVLRTESVPQADWDHLIRRVPLQHAATEQALAGALEFLLKNESITGQTIVVDSGYSLI